MGAAGFEKAPLELQGGHAPPHSENHDRCMTGASGELERKQGFSAAGRGSFRLQKVEKLQGGQG